MHYMSYCFKTFWSKAVSYINRINICFCCKTAAINYNNIFNKSVNYQHLSTNPLVIQFNYLQLYVIILSLTSFTLYSLPECQGTQRRRLIWSLSDSNRIWTHNHLVCKRTLNHLTKLAKLLSCVVSTYLYGVFDCMLLSCHYEFQSESRLYSLPQCHRTPCLYLQHSSIIWPVRLNSWVFLYELSGC